MKALLARFLIAFLCAAPALAQPQEMRQQISAMEITLFSKTYCKDAPIRRIERLEENFSEPFKQKKHRSRFWAGYCRQNRKERGKNVITRTSNGTTKPLSRSKIAQQS